MIIKPQNFEERLVWYYLLGTYLWYFLGAQYVLAPALAWFLTLYLCKKLWDQTENTPSEEKITIPVSIWVWIISMLILEVTIVVSHIDFNLETSRIFVSTFNWGRHHALMALFPLIGCLNIRPQIIYRAICIVVLQSLVFITIAYVAFTLKILPNALYASPLIVAGNGFLPYYIQLYLVEYTGVPRLSLFAPWPPALGLVANIYFLLACQELNRNWRWIGMFGSVAMIVVSVARAAWLCLPVNLLFTLLLINFSKPVVQITTGLVSFFTGIFASQLINLLETFRDDFDSLRPESSKVRGFLGDIGIYRWLNEAPIWGHGIPDSPGPKLVERMPVGTHSTWVGSLFTSGVIGFIALAVPFLWSFIDLLIKAQKSKCARVGLSTIFVLFFLSFAENVEGLAYIYWPGLLIMGIAFKEVVYVKKSFVSIG